MLWCKTSRIKQRRLDIFSMRAEVRGLGRNNSAALVFAGDRDEEFLSMVARLHIVLCY